MAKIKKASVHIPLEVIAFFKDEVARLYRSGHDLDLQRISNISIAEYALRHFFTLPIEERDKAFEPLMSAERPVFTSEIHESVEDVA